MRLTHTWHGSDCLQAAVSPKCPCSLVTPMYPDTVCIREMVTPLLFITGDDDG